MTPSWNTVKWSAENRIGVLQLNRPEKLNALSRELARESLEAVEQAGDLRVLIITGTERAFSAGWDLSEGRVGAPVQSGPTLRDLMDFLIAAPFPVIAAIEGYALGGGLELSLCCDIRVASETAKLGLPEALRGILPGGGGTQRLPRLVGQGRAKEIMFTCDPIDAHTALSWGLVNRVTPAGEALMAAKQLAERMLRAAPLSLKEIKHAIGHGAHLELTAALVVEREGAQRLRASDDSREGIMAFLEKRQPNWQGH